jgi:sugar transferase (PEP-CTERM/EpsH1 system associated)
MHGGSSNALSKRALWSRLKRVAHARERFLPTRRRLGSASGFKRLTPVKILYLAHRIPYPPNKGEKIRTFHQIQQLARRHTIHLCSFLDDPRDLPGASELREHCASVEVVYHGQARILLLAVAAFLKRSPFSVSLFYRKALAEKVAQKAATERFDCIIVSSSSMAQYACLVPRVPKILDFIDLDSEKWGLYAQHRMSPLSLIYRLEAQRLAKYEEEMAHLFDHSIVISEEERRVFQKRVSNGPVAVISNGVDLEYFSPRGNVAPKISQPVIVFTGAMDYFPNVDAVQYFCHEIFPLVRRELFGARFYIVGRNPTRPVRELSKQANVIVTGTVPDVRPYLAQATVAVAPFRLARGLQNKVLESMAMGVPVVGTTEAFKGIAATDHDGILIADDPASFARHVISLVQADAESWRGFSAQARSYVERHHRWEDQGEKLERILQKVVHKNYCSVPPEMKSAALA